MSSPEAMGEGIDETVAFGAAVLAVLWGED